MRNTDILRHDAPFAADFPRRLVTASAHARAPWRAPFIASPPTPARPHPAAPPPSFRNVSVPRNGIRRLRPHLGGGRAAGAGLSSPLVSPKRGIVPESCRRRYSPSAFASSRPSSTAPCQRHSAPSYSSLLKFLSRYHGVAALAAAAAAVAAAAAPGAQTC